MKLEQPVYSKLCDVRPYYYNRYLISYNLYLDYIRSCSNVAIHDGNGGVGGPVMCNEGVVISDFNSAVVSNVKGVNDALVGAEGTPVGGDSCDGVRSVDSACGTARVINCDTQLVSEKTLANRAKRQLAKERKKRNKAAGLSVDVSKRKLMELQVLELRLQKEREQLAISQAFRVKQEQQAEISRVFREKQERMASDAVSVAECVEVKRKRERLQSLRLDQQLKMWDSSDEAVERRKKELVARSELNIARYENMKERKLKLQEIERKENWREEASGGGSLPPSAVSSKPSVSSSVSARSSASQGVASSASSVFSGKSKVSNGVAERLRAIQRKAELLAIFDSDGEFQCGADESEARLYDMDRDAAQRAKARKLAEAKVNVKKGWF